MTEPRRRKATTPQRPPVDPDDIDLEIGTARIYDSPDPDLDEPIAVDIGRARIDPEPPPRRRGRVRGNVDMGNVEVIRSEDGGTTTTTDEGRVIEIDPVEIVGDVPRERPTPTATPARQRSGFATGSRIGVRDALRSIPIAGPLMGMTGLDERLANQWVGTAEEFADDPAEAGLALAEGIGQGGTMSLGDDIATGFLGGSDYLADTIRGEDADLDRSLSEAREGVEEPIRRARTRAPNTFATAEELSAIPSAVALPSIGPAGGGMVRGAIRGGLTGGIYSGIQAIGSSDADTLGGRLEDAARPAAAGVGIGAGLGLLPPALRARRERQGRIAQAQIDSLRARQAQRGAPISPNDDLADVMRGTNNGPVDDGMELVDDIDRPIQDDVVRPPFNDQNTRGQRPAPRPRALPAPVETVPDEALANVDDVQMLDDLDQPIVEPAPIAAASDEATGAARPAALARRGPPVPEDGTRPLRVREQPVGSALARDDRGRIRAHAQEIEPVAVEETGYRDPAPAQVDEAALRRRRELLAPIGQDGQRVQGDRGLGLTPEDLLGGDALDPDVQRLRGAGVTTIPQAQRVMRVRGGVPRVSEVLAETGVLPRGRVDRTSNILARAEAARERAGQAVGAIETEAAERGAIVDVTDAVAEMRRNGRALINSGNDRARAAGENLMRRATRLEARANQGRISLRYALSEIRTEDDIAAQWGRNPGADITPDIQNSRLVRRLLRQSVNRAVERVDPQLARDYAIARERMQVLSTIAPRGVPRERLAAFHRARSMSDYQAGGAGAAAGAAMGSPLGPVGSAVGAAIGGIGSAAGNRYYRSIEGSFLARVYEGAPIPPGTEDIVMARLQTVAQVDPAAFGPLASEAAMAAIRATVMGDDAFREWMRSVAQRGPEAIQAVDDAAYQYNPDEGLSPESDMNTAPTQDGDFDPNEGL